jgi:Putative Actinobacterial Holin-X, holin superfamily III
MMHDSENDRGAGVTDLACDALHVAEELWGLEVALAKTEAVRQGRALKTSAVAFAIGITSVVVGLFALVIAVVFAWGAVGALALGLALVASSVFAGVVGFVHLPSEPMAGTLRRLKLDKRLVREHLS